MNLYPLQHGYIGGRAQRDNWGTAKGCGILTSFYILERCNYLSYNPGRYFWSGAAKRVKASWGGVWSLFLRHECRQPFHLFKPFFPLCLLLNHFHLSKNKIIFTFVRCFLLRTFSSFSSLLLCTQAWKDLQTSWKPPKRCEKITDLKQLKINEINLLWQ